MVEGLVRVLVACEFTGVVRDAFRERGHDAMSCDLLPTEHSGPHYQGDVRNILHDDWDLIIAHPECTYHCLSSVRWLMDAPANPKPGVNYGGNRWVAWEEACNFFLEFLSLPDRTKVCVENPKPHGYSLGRLGRYTQIIQPWQFGHQEIKGTALWLRGLPPLVPTVIVGPPPLDPIARRAWAEVHRATPGPDRQKDRSRTYLGIAEAMAQQWGGV